MAHAIFNRLAARADRLASRASFLAAAAVAAKRHGVSVSNVVTPPSPQEQANVALAALGRADKTSAQIATARHEALYLAVTACGRSQKSVARATGLSPKAIRKALAAVEDRRDDPKFDRELDRAAAVLMGA